MEHDWILDVLTDLRSFAKDNDFLTLAAQLEDTHLVAAIEIATLAERAPFWIDAFAVNNGSMYAE